MSKVTVGAAQACPCFLDLAGSTQKACGLIAEAGRQEIQLLVFPEAWLPGYPFWIWTDSVPVGAHWGHRPVREAYARLFANSVEVPSTTTAQLGRAAREAGVIVVVGCNERVGNTLYNSLLYLSEKGEILGVHRKLMPTYTERLVWGLGDGSTMTTYDTRVGRVGGLICWEHWMPLQRFHLHSQGEQIHVAAWPAVMEGIGSFLASKSYAFEGRTFVVAAGSVLLVDSLPTDVSLFSEWTPPANGFIHRGGSTIIGPDGSTLVEPVHDEERLVTAEIDLSIIPQELLSLDVCGHYHRPDIFTLKVDKTARILGAKDVESAVKPIPERSA